MSSTTYFKHGRIFVVSIVFLSFVPTDRGPCVPNPCQNAGICVEEGAGYRCDCSKTRFTGSTCEIGELR